MLSGLVPRDLVLRCHLYLWYYFLLFTGFTGTAVGRPLLGEGVVGLRSSYFETRGAQEEIGIHLSM